MNILVFNAGSSSQKSCLYSLDTIGEAAQPPDPIWEAQIDWRPQEKAATISVHTAAGVKVQETVDAPSRSETLLYLLNFLHAGPTRVVANLGDIDVVGHRVVHGGKDYQESVRVTPDVKATIARLSAIAPSHNPANLEGIELMEQLLPEVPQVAVFDTAFHSQIPEVAFTYPGPYSWREQGIRRYGFHGISHRYCTSQAAQLLDRSVDDLRLVICHLGNGGSLAAVKNGHSIDTTMGFTPLDGLMMGTRSGAVDPGILIHLMREGGSADEIDWLLNKGSGLAGISGVSHDLREISKAIAQGNPRAELAQAMYVHRLKSCLGSMLMSLGGADAVVFTAGIGEHSPQIRAAACEGLAFLGVALDLEANEQNPVDRDIATAESAMRVLVIRTQEDWAIAQDCWQLLVEG
ncbi:MAG: acetate kinase [Cyanobacteria bacterium J06598_1]